MTIGPEPIRQIERRSLLRGTGDLLDPALEEWPRVVRPRSRLRVELRRAGTQLGKVEALDRLVVERHVRRLGIVRRCDREAVVLARDEDAAGRALEHRVGRAAVAEGEPERLV